MRFTTSFLVLSSLLSVIVAAPMDPRAELSARKSKSTSVKATKTKTSSAIATAAATTVPSGSASASSPSSGSLQSMLQPITPLSSWTVAAGLPGALTLSDATLNITRDSKDLKHPYLQKEGKLAMSATYPKGSFNLSHKPRGGFSFYALGPKGKIDLDKAREVVFGYSVFFPEGFDFVKGGKLPGLFGGDTLDGSFECSGGSRNNKCFSARLMFRADGQGEMYTYLPPDFDANQRICNLPPKSECNPVFGASIARGAFTFPTGQWNTVAVRVRLNDAGKEDGELQLWANGKSVFSVNGLVIRDSDTGRIRGDQMQTFFGGGSVGFATPKDQQSFFADFTMSVTEEL